MRKIFSVTVDIAVLTLLFLPYIEANPKATVLFVLADIGMWLVSFVSKTPFFYLLLEGQLLVSLAFTLLGKIVSYEYYCITLCIWLFARCIPKSVKGILARKKRITNQEQKVITKEEKPNPTISNGSKQDSSYPKFSSGKTGFAPLLSHEGQEMSDIFKKCGWTTWGRYTHITPTQRKKIEMAKSGKIEIISYNELNKTARVLGEEDKKTKQRKEYFTSENFCSCYDFRFRRPHYPCKHIYALAIYLSDKKLQEHLESTSE